MKNQAIENKQVNQNLSAHPTHPSKSAYGYALACVFIWAGFVLMSRIAGQTPLNGYDLAMLRFGTAALVLLPAWLFWKRVSLMDTRYWFLSVLGICYAATVYTSFRYAPAAHGAVLLSGTLPFTVTFMAVIVLHQKPSRYLWLALFFVGIGLIFLANHSLLEIDKTWRGDVLLLIGSLLWACYTVWVKRWQLKPWETTIAVSLCSLILYLPIYVLFLPKGLLGVPWQDIVMQSLYQGVMVMIVAMLFYMKALTGLGATRLGAFMSMVPAVAGLGVTLILGEAMSASLIFGLIFTSIGAWLGGRDS